MATVNMDSVQFYQPPFMKPLFGSEQAAPLHINPKHPAAPRHKNGSQVFTDGWGDFGSQYNSGRDQDAVSEDDGGHINTAQPRLVDLGDTHENPVLIDDDESDNTDTEAASTDSNPDDPGRRDYSGGGSIAADEDDEFLPIDEVIRRALHSEDSTEKPTYSALAAQGANEISFPDGCRASMPAQSSLPGHLDGSKEQLVILDDDDDSNSLSGGGISSDLSADGTDRELSPPPSPKTPYPSSRPSSSRDPSLHPSTAPYDQSLEGQAIQQNDGYISHEMSEHPSCPALILLHGEDDETEKGQQQQGAGEGRKQGARIYDTSGNGDVDGDDNLLQDSDENEGLQPTKRRLSPSRDPAVGRSRRRRLQPPRYICSNPSKLAGADPVLVQKETLQPAPLVPDDSDDSDDSDYSEAPRPAKRRRLSPSNSNPTPNRSQRWRLQRPSESRSSSPSKLDRSRKAPPQTQLKLSPNSDDCAQSQHSSTRSPTDNEQISATAEYREWPMHGFFKRTTIGNETHYSIDFSLEQLQRLCAIACPLHAIPPNSDRDISAGLAKLPKVSTQAKKARLAPPSRSKRTPFTSKENAMLLDLKENKGWPWKRIEPKFPQRTLNSLQVHYCTKLKGKVLTEGDESM